MALGDFFKKQEGGPEHFWSLVIGKTWVQAAIWRVVGEATEVVSEGSTASWQDGNDESLVEAADGSLSAAAANIGDDVSEPNKVVFGLSPSWIQDGTIKQERLGILKKLSNELELTPAGFVVIPEAITHYLKAREGAPPNTILVGLADDAIDVTLVQNGRNLGTVEVGQSISLGSDVSEGLSRLPSVSQYPSRILLYNHKVGNLEDARQNLFEANWEKVKVPFLHTPKVEILPEDVAVTAVSLAGGAEVGQAKSIILPNREEETAENEEAGEEIAGDEFSLPQERGQEEVKDLGFVRGGDVAEQELISVGGTQAPETSKFQSSPVSFGERSQTSEDHKFDYAVGEIAPPKRVKLAGAGYILRAFTSFFSNIRLPSFGLRGAGMLGVASTGFILLLAGGGLAYWYLPTAQVTVYVAPRKLEKTLKLTVDSKLTVVDQAKKIIPGLTRDVNVSGDKTATTTGEKTVGEKARGPVTILHVGGSALLKSGTTLIGPNNLKFTLDNDTTVASGSSLTKPSKATALITAANIGAEYNLASDTEFSVGNFAKSDFVATNDNALSGGTSRSVSAVSEDDRANLEKELTNELLSWGTEELKKSLSENEVLVAEAATLMAEAKDFSHKTGEEASTLKLSLAGKVTATIIPQDAVNLLVMSELEKDVPGGYTLKSDQISVNYKIERPQPKTQTKTGTSQTAKKTETDERIVSKAELKISAEIVANLLPKVNPEELAQAISGKYPTVAREYLATTPGYKRADISLSIQLPGKLGTLPRIAKNIIVEVASEQ